MITGNWRLNMIEFEVRRLILIYLVMSAAS